MMMTEEGIIGCAFNSGSLEAQANLSVCDRGQQVLPRDFQASWCYRDSGSKTNKETYKTDMNIDLTKQTDSHFVFCFQNLFHFLVTVRTRFHCLLLSKKSSVNVSYIGNKCSLEVSVEEN